MIGAVANEWRYAANAVKNVRAERGLPQSFAFGSINVGLLPRSSVPVARSAAELLDPTAVARGPVDARNEYRLDVGGRGCGIL